MNTGENIPEIFRAYLGKLRRELHLESAVCVICGRTGKFSIAVPGESGKETGTYDDFLSSVNLRENIFCDGCGSSSRDRMLVYAFGRASANPGPLNAWRELPHQKVFETAGRRGHPPFLSGKFDYYNTDFDPEKMKSGYDSRKYADLQSLPYDDSFFDYVLSSDVFEHVRLYQQAFREVYRVLKPGGVLVMTVPYVHGWEKTLVKVEPRGDEDVFLTEPEYHGGHTLVYRIYGRDLLPFLRGIGFTVGYLEFSKPKYAISFQNVILGVKDDYLDLSNFMEEP